MPRLLVLCVHPRDSSPSQRYRFEQFEPYLRSKGFEVTYAPALHRHELRTFYGATNVLAKGMIALRAMARRAVSVAPWPLAARYDLVFVQREAFFLFGAWSEWLAHQGAPIVFDFDDAIWIRQVSTSNQRFALLKNVGKVSRLVAMADVVLAGNRFLADWARRSARDVRLIPTCVDTAHYLPRASARGTDRVTIGWCGSPSTIDHLRLIVPTLERIQAVFGDRVRFRAMGDPSFTHAPLDLRCEPWNSTDELTFLQDLDIGLMPLPDDEWAKGKCGLKALTSMACGAATIVSPVGVNTQIVQHGINGMVARTEEEWFQALHDLVLDSDLRARLCAAGRKTVVEKYSVAVWSEPLLEALCDAMGSKA